MAFTKSGYSFSKPSTKKGPPSQPKYNPLSGNRTGQRSNRNKAQQAVQRAAGVTRAANAAKSANTAKAQQAVQKAGKIAGTAKAVSSAGKVSQASKAIANATRAAQAARAIAGARKVGAAAAPARPTSSVSGTAGPVKAAAAPVPAKPPAAPVPPKPPVVTTTQGTGSAALGRNSTTTGRGTFGRFNRQRLNRGPKSGMSVTPEMLQAAARQRIVNYH